MVGLFGLGKLTGFGLITRFGRGLADATQYNKRTALYL